MTTAKGGPKSIEQRLSKYDYSKIELMGRFRATYQTMADELGLGLSTIEKKMASATRFRRCYKKGQSHMRLTLAEAQIKKAIDELNPALLIWLGKQHLGQADKIESNIKQEIKGAVRLFG